MKREPIACWLVGCYLAVDKRGRCSVHGRPPSDAERKRAAQDHAIIDAVARRKVSP